MILTNEQLKESNDWINKKIKESRFKKKEKNKKIVLTVGTEAMKKLIEIFNLKINN